MLAAFGVIIDFASERLRHCRPAGRERRKRTSANKSKFRAERAFYLFRGSLAQERPEYVIPQRCADAGVRRRELMMSSVMPEQYGN